MSKQMYRELLSICRDYTKSVHPEAMLPLQQWAKKHGVEFPPTIHSYADALVSAIQSALDGATAQPDREKEPRNP